uniref:G-protein coupled receptors family 1 profile domain-containing protein n=1 Tax=Erpetoichthys calabaricus TaxID=27687 RepID=A0A8C4SUU4_ERPCA
RFSGPITISLLTFIYFLSMFGNLLVIVVIILKPQLHAPMYIYIGTLAVIDLANSSILIPKMLSVLLLGSPVVSYAACVLQIASQKGKYKCYLIKNVASKSRNIILKPYNACRRTYREVLLQLLVTRTAYIARVKNR